MDITPDELSKNLELSPPAAKDANSQPHNAEATPPVQNMQELAPISPPPSTHQVHPPVEPLNSSPQHAMMSQQGILSYIIRIPSVVSIVSILQ